MTSGIILVMLTMVLLSSDCAERMYSLDFNEGLIRRVPRPIASVIVQQSWPRCLIGISTKWTECPIPGDVVLNIVTNTHNRQKKDFIFSRLLKAGNVDEKMQTERTHLNRFTKPIESHLSRLPLLDHTLLKLPMENYRRLLPNSLRNIPLPLLSTMKPESKPQLLPQVNNISKRPQTDYHHSLQIGSLFSKIKLPAISTTYPIKRFDFGNSYSALPTTKEPPLDKNHSFRPLVTADINKLSFLNNKDVETSLHVAHMKTLEIAQKMNSTTPRINNNIEDKKLTTENAVSDISTQVDGTTHAGTTPVDDSGQTTNDSTSTVASVYNNDDYGVSKAGTRRVTTNIDPFNHTRRCKDYPKYDNAHTRKGLFKVITDPTTNRRTNKFFQILNDYTMKNGTNVSSLDPEELDERRKAQLLDTFTDALDKLERKFYTTTFNKLTSISPVERQENGISFVQSGLFLSLFLMALSTETDQETRAEIDQCLALNFTDTDKIEVIESLLTMLPNSSDDLKFRRSSRLVLGASQNVSKQFECGAAAALHMYLGKLKGNETDEELASDLNHMVEQDSGGAIHDTFEPEELSSGVRAVALTTVYLRARWRSAPTVLNGSRAFRDADGAPARASRMIRINDVMRYADHHDGHFQALEISYSTPGLTLLLLIPHGRSLRPLAGRLDTTSLADITRHMATMRVAATMPLYTLRMTLLLPSKLQTMGINKLMSDANSTDDGSLKLSHAVQRLMFWAEAGRNAFKDDGIEWDAAPELELVVDRPYLFFVRWHNITLMNGNFVL